MEESKKGMSPILIVILVLVGSCLLGVGLWYGLNYFKGEDKPVDTPTEETNNSNVLTSELKDIFYNNSSAIKIPLYPSKEKVYENYEKINRKIGNLSVDYECIVYSKVDFEYGDEHHETKNMCSTVKATINNNISFYYRVDYNEIIPEIVLAGGEILETISEKDKNVNKIFVNDKELLYYNDFFIDTHHWCCGTDTSTLIVYNKSGSKVFEVKDDIRTVYFDLYNLNPTVKDSKLYYMKSNNEVCELNYVDLTTNNLSSTFVKKLPGYDCMAYEK